MHIVEAVRVRFFVALLSLSLSEELVSPFQALTPLAEALLAG